MGFESVDALKVKLREVITDEGRSRSERELAEQMEAALLKANHMPVPPALVTAQLEHMIETLQRQVLRGRDEFTAQQVEEFKTKLRPQAEDRVRLSFLLPAIAQREKIDVAEPEVAAELEKSLAAAPTEERKEAVRRSFAGNIRTTSTRASTTSHDCSGPAKTIQRTSG